MNANEILSALGSIRVPHKNGPIRLPHVNQSLDRLALDACFDRFYNYSIEEKEIPAEEEIKFLKSWVSQRTKSALRAYGQGNYHFQLWQLERQIEASDCAPAK